MMGRVQLVVAGLLLSLVFDAPLSATALSLEKDTADSSSSTSASSDADGDGEAEQPNPNTLHTTAAQLDVSRVFARRPVGPQDQTRSQTDMSQLTGQGQAPPGHAITLQKLGLRSLPPTTCAPSLFEVHEVAHPTANAKFSWGSMRADDVLQHILSSLSSVSYASMPLSSMHNVDGRLAQGVVATMGADAGELLLAFNAFEKFTPQPLTPNQTALLLYDYLLTTDIEALSLQMDTAALEALCEAGCCMPACRIDAPAEGVQQKLLDVLGTAAAQGSAHFRHLLAEPKLFETRAELTRSFIQAYFRLLWRTPAHRSSPAALASAARKLRLVILQGPHRERALLHVRTGGCASYRIPRVVPELGAGGSLFVMHDDAAQLRRAFNADFMTEQAKKMALSEVGGYDRDLLIARMNTIANTQYLRALALDNGRTPTFSINWPSQCCV